MKTFVLFGSTGNLATRYVLPALGSLLQKGAYDHLICVGRRDWTRDEFRTFLAPFPDLLNHTETISYVRLDIEGGDFSALKNELEKIKNSNKTTPFLKGDTHDSGEGDLSGINPQPSINSGSSFKKELSETVYHLCLSPEYFVTVAKGLADVGLNGEYSRIMIEKPFGYDLESARRLNTEIQKYFNENQIYRVDHYLGKNFVQEFYVYKTTEMIDWHDDTIKEIRIVAREEVAMEGRGEYYDKSGATRDFLQNHLLQILAIATMQTPVMPPGEKHVRPLAEGEEKKNKNGGFGDGGRGDGEVQQSKLQALKSIKPLLVDPNHDVIMGQYEGYLQEPGVRPNSRTETYIRVHLKLDAPWKNTDIILETGKALDRKESSITLVFHDGREKIFAETPTNKNNSYETLIEQSLNHESVFFVPWENVEAAWHVVNDLLHCTDNCPILKFYKAGSQEV